MFRQARFRSFIGSDAADRGQMLFHAKLEPLLLEKVNEALAKDPALQPVLQEWLDAIGNFDWATADERRRELTNTKFPAALIGPDDSRLEVGGTIFHTLWKAYSKPDATLPDLNAYMTLSQYQALRRYEFQACKETARYVAKRYVGSGGAGGKRGPDTAIPLTQLVGGVKDDEKDLGGGLHRGTVATFSHDLGKQVERMRRAIDDGWVIHARVLSGYYGGGASHAEAKHSLVVYGHTGDTFEFFDPDVGGSNLARTGFDSLHYDRDANRLSTARTEADFAVYKKPGPEGSGQIHGWQASGVHRYQVTSIETL
jgi:hypothetical protein